MAAGSTATIASAGDPDKRQALIDKAFSGVDRSGGHNMDNVATMMQNVSRMVQSSDVAQQAVGYAIAGAVAKAVGYPGGGEGIAANASVLAGAAKDLEAVKESLAPSGATDKLTSTSKLDQAVPRDIAATTKGLGADPDHLAPRASRVTEDNIPSVADQAASISNKAEAGRAATLADQNHTEADGSNAVINRRTEMAQSPDNINKTFTEQTGTSDVIKSVKGFVGRVEKALGDSQEP